MTKYIDTEKLKADLEEAAKEYAKTTFKKPYSDNPDEEVTIVEPDKYAGFIAGAKWQAEQLLKGSPMPEDTVLFNKGVEEGKRLMMEEAVEGEIVKDINNRLVMTAKNVNLDGFKFGEKVRIIIVKE